MLDEIDLNLHSGVHKHPVGSFRVIWLLDVTGLPQPNGRDSRKFIIAY
jgi:hypothetical protein